MRDTISKLMTVSMVAGAALLVSACGSTEPAVNNTANVTELNAMDDTMMNGTTDDNMTGADGTNAMDGSMSADNSAMNAMDSNAMNGANGM